MKTRSKQKNFLKKRRSERVPDALAQYYLFNQPNFVETVLLKNVSTGGICFYSHDQIKIGDSIRIKLLLIGLDDPIITTGKVIWHRKSDHYSRYEIGLKFVVLTQYDYENLNKLIELRLAAMSEFEQKLSDNNISLDLSGPGELF